MEVGCELRLQIPSRLASFWLLLSLSWALGSRFPHPHTPVWPMWNEKGQD